MKILLVVAHGRPTSLTNQAADAFAAAARSRGHVVEVADLAAEGFDPVLHEEDEPDWSNPGKTYSEVVRREMARIERNDATVIFFPVWWWSMPALLKGWIDRVWNHGWAYGGKTYPHRRVLMVGIAGTGRAAYEASGYDAAMETQIVTGILRYCGIEDGRLEMLFGVLEDDGAPEAVIAASEALGRTF